MSDEAVEEEMTFWNDSLADLATWSASIAGHTGLVEASVIQVSTWAILLMYI
jgi:hypothetical protein